MPQAAPDRGGLPLNVNAAPFVPSSPSQETAPPQQCSPAPNSAIGSWKAQADALGGHQPQHVQHNPYSPAKQYAQQPQPYQAQSHQPYQQPYGYQGPVRQAHLSTPPSAYPLQADIPPHPGTQSAGSSRQHTPVQRPHSNGSTPVMGNTPVRGATQAKCPSGHTLVAASGSQKVKKNEAIVECGNVFCRWCDAESLEKLDHPYYTCTTCMWDLCKECMDKTVEFNPPPMQLSQGVHRPPLYGDELVAQIRLHLHDIGETEPFGLTNMPYDRLVIYEERLRRKVEALHPPPQPVVDVAPKVNVTKTHERNKREKKNKKMRWQIGDRVMFTAGGRFAGNKKWKDGPTLTQGEIGEILQIDHSATWPYKIQFEHVYVMLTEADVTDAPPEPERNQKREKQPRDRKKKERTDPVPPQQEKTKKPDVPPTSAATSTSTSASTQARPQTLSSTNGSTAPGTAPSTSQAEHRSRSPAAAAATQQRTPPGNTPTSDTRPAPSVFDGPSVPLLLASAGLCVAAFFMLRSRSHK